MSDTPQYLLRSWGGDLQAVVKLREPDTYERDDHHVACWWFDSAEEREAFIKQFSPMLNAVRDRVNPGLDRDGEETIDTRTMTVAVVTLKTPDGQIGTFDMSFGYGYPEHSASYMFEEGNYSCDCNRRDFLHDYCGIGDGHLEDMNCGDTIELVSLTFKHIPFAALHAHETPAP